MRKVVAMALMLAVVLGAQYMAWRGRAAVTVTVETLAGNPVDHFHPAEATGNVVLVAHGFGANKELMRPWGYYLAQRGFDTYILDEPGHGASPVRLPAWQGEGRTPLGDNLRATIDALVSRQAAQSGHIALLGHSMGGTAVTQAALADDRVRATVALSSAYRDPLPDAKPVNLLSIAAERDPGNMVKSVQALAAKADNGKGLLGKQYGAFADGTARQSDVVAGRNHITILYDADVMDRSARWIGESLGLKAFPEGAGVSYGWPWIAIGLAGALGLVLSVVLLLAPAAGYRSARNQSRTGLLTGLMMLAVAAFSAVLAVVFVRIPWLHLSVADYLLPYFLTMALVLLVLRLVWPRDFGFAINQDQEPVLAALLRGLGIFLGFAGAAGPVIHSGLANFLPTPARIVPMVIMAVGFWLYLVQEEALKRAVTNTTGPAAAAGLGVVGKLVVAATWIASAALPNPPTILNLAIPVIVVLMLLLEVYSFFMNRWRYSAVASATFGALVLAWTLAVTYPLVQ